MAGGGVAVLWSLADLTDYPARYCCRLHLLCHTHQESLSLSHAVTVVLSQLYAARLSATAADPLAAQYTVSQPQQLAAGYDAAAGREH